MAKKANSTKTATQVQITVAHSEAVSSTKKVTNKQALQNYLEANPGYFTAGDLADIYTEIAGSEKDSGKTNITLSELAAKGRIAKLEAKKRVFYSSVEFFEQDSENGLAAAGEFIASLSDKRRGTTQKMKSLVAKLDINDDGTIDFQKLMDAIEGQ